MSAKIFGVEGVRPAEAEEGGEEFEWRFGPFCVDVSFNPMYNPPYQWTWAVSYTRDEREVELLEYNPRATSVELAAEMAERAIQKLAAEMLAAFPQVFPEILFTRAKIQE